MSLIKKILSKSLLTILMLQMLNISIYNTHFYNFTAQEIRNKKHIEYNPIDSFAELILEEFAGIENAIPEQDPQSEQQKASKHHLNTPHLNLHYFPDLNLNNRELELERAFTLWSNQYEFDYLDEIIHPPTLNS